MTQMSVCEDDITDQTNPIKVFIKTLILLFTSYVVYRYLLLTNLK